MLEPLSDHSLVIPVVCGTKCGAPWRLLLVATIYLSDRMQVILLVINETWVMRLLRHLREITSLAIAHPYFPVMSLHILMQTFCLSHCLAIYSPQYLLVPVIDRVNIVRSSILHWKSFLKFCNASRLSKLFFAAHDT